MRGSYDEIVALQKPYDPTKSHGARTGVPDATRGARLRLAAPVLAAIRRRRTPVGRRGGRPFGRGPGFDPVGDELAGGLPHRVDHARASAALARLLHGIIDDPLGGRETWVGMVLLGAVFQEQLGKAFLARRGMSGRIGRSSERTAR